MDGLYLKNEIWSPLIANAGSGTVYRVIYDRYADRVFHRILSVNKIRALIIMYPRRTLQGSFTNHPDE